MSKRPHRRLKHYSSVSVDLLEQRVLLSGQLFVVNYSSGTIGEYTTSGATMNASLVSGLGGPWGLAVSGSNLFVTNSNYNTGNDEIREYTTSGAMVTPSLVSGWVNPVGLAVSGSNLFVVNPASGTSAPGGTIGKYTTSGATVNAPLVSGVNYPGGIAVSGSHLFVTNRANGTIGEYTTSGATVNASLVSGLNNPSGIAVSGSYLFVTSFDGGTIGEYTTSGATVNARLVSGLSLPEGIAVSGSYLFVTNSDIGTIGEYTTSGVTVNASLVSGLHTPIGIAVTDASPPTNVTLTASRIAELQPAGVTVGTLVATDPNVGDTFTYRLVSGAAYPDNASFTVIGDQLNTTAELNYETKSSYSIRVRVTDQTGQSLAKTLTIGVKNINETPTSLALSPRRIAENMPAGTVVGNFSTVDPDIGNTFTYTMAEGGVDNAAFTITADGRLKTNQAFDFETKSIYSISVRSTDQGGLFCEKAITIKVMNANEAPTDLALTNYSVLEHQLTGTLVGTLLGTDPDAGNTLTYTLVGGVGSPDNAMFKILNGKLRTAAVFNYATKSVYKVRVRVTDQGGLWFDKAIKIGVTQ